MEILRDSPKFVEIKSPDDLAVAGLRAKVAQSKREILLIVHPLHIRRQNQDTKEFYSCLGEIKSLDTPIIVFLTSEDIEDTISEFGDSENETIYLIRTVSQADAQPTFGWENLEKLLQTLEVKTVELAGQNISFWYNVEGNQLPDWIQSFSSRFQDLLSKIVPENLRQEVKYLFPVHCLGSFWVKLFTFIPNVNFRINKAMYPVYFRNMGNGRTNVQRARIDNIDDEDY
jgi:hypothetical protein